jgi:hypothetical protein
MDEPVMHRYALAKKGERIYEMLITDRLWKEQCAMVSDILIYGQGHVTTRLGDIIVRPYRPRLP